MCYNSGMEKSESQEVKAKRGVKLTDIIIGVVFVIICGFLLSALLHQLSLKHEVTAAKTVSNRVITDISKDDAADARSLGRASFQKAHSNSQLSALFKQIPNYAKGTPAVDRQTVTNDKSGQAVAIIYKYPKSPVFYIRVIIIKPTGATKWQLATITGNTTEKPLLNN